MHPQLGSLLFLPFTQHPRTNENSITLPLLRTVNYLSPTCHKRIHYSTPEQINFKVGALIEGEGSGGNGGEGEDGRGNGGEGQNDFLVIVRKDDLVTLTKKYLTPHFFSIFPSVN